MLWNTIACLFATMALGVAARAEPAQLTLAGETALNGIFDPSIERAPGSEEGWLAYSAVYGDILPWGPHVEARLARTVDGGLTFSQHSVVNASQIATLVLPDQTTLDGVWNYETSSLVYVPDDAGAEWKLFSHRVFRLSEDDFTGEQTLPAYSWIVLRTAPHPAGPWSPEVALLSSGPLPPAPYDNVQFAINAMDSMLSSLLVYAEPGAFYRAGVLYLSLTGLLASGPDRIVLLASDDHGASWRYAGTPLASADAAALGFLSFDGSAIASQGERVFLLTTPESAGVLHDGTLVIEFAELETGLLVREAGTPVVSKHLPPLPGLPADRRGGQADFHDGFAIGIVMPSLQMEDYPRFFQIYATGEFLTEPPALPSLRPATALLCVMAIGASARRWVRRPLREARG